MAALFSEYPEAIANTVAIADRCSFNLATDIREIYSFPGYDLPEGETEIGRLKEICEEAAKTKYANKDGATLLKLRERLDEEFRLIEKYDLAGFLLQYHDIIKIAHEVQLELGIVDPGTTIEQQPPGRGRGSSVALVIGYLIGLSHIDPIEFDLKLERFLPDMSDADVEEVKRLPALDIDLDFPREIREELILRVHNKKGPEFAALTGMISTYRIRGAIRDLGKALGLPEEDLGQLVKLIDGHAGIGDLPEEMAQLSEYRDKANGPLWKELLELSRQLNHFPKYLAQHPGGMILSARPLSDAVPMQRSAIDGRFICQWEKDSADDAGFVKIDFLALGALSQMTEALQLIRRHKEEPVDLSRIDFDDEAVYEDIHRADTIGIFQIESAAQMQTVVRLKPKNLEEMAWEVGAVRPGVGVNDGVSMLIRRHLGLEEVHFDHKLEEEALGRTKGVPLFQDQLAELAVHVAGMTPLQGDRMRRAFTRRDKDRQVPEWHKRFIEGALKKGVSLEAAEKIFKKFHGEYQFPEAHAYAFGVTAYQMSWLKHYHKLEFFVGLFNNQPMGFYNLETLKEDAHRHEVTVLNPDVNLSEELAVMEEGKLRLGLTHVANVRKATGALILAVRRKHGLFNSLADFMARTGVQQDALDSLTAAGAFDCFDPRHQSSSEEPADRRSLRWEIGLRYRPVGQQLAFELPVAQDMVALREESEWEQMMGEYGSMGVYPTGHIMKLLRSRLPGYVERSDNLRTYSEGADVTVAGLVIRRQRPSGKATFITLEDEFGHSPLVIWPTIYKRIRRQTTSAVLMARGKVSKREGTLNIVVDDAWAVPTQAPNLKTKDWG
jgi:error-prone DNA polymerase